MLVHTNSSFSVFFGDIRTHIRPDVLKTESLSGRALLAREPFTEFKKVLNITDLVILHQVHGADGCVVSSAEHAASMAPWHVDGDYLITNVPGTGLAAVTADCLPVVVHDPFAQAVGIAHAGWRGAVAGVVTTMLEKMCDAFSSDREQLKLFFGPSANVCCYRVSDDFEKELDDFSYGHEFLHQADDGIYFDLPGFVRMQLIEGGIKKKQINTSYNECTIHNKAFCSVRRSAGAPERQLSVVALK